MSLARELSVRHRTHLAQSTAKLQKRPAEAGVSRSLAHVVLPDHPRPPLWTSRATPATVRAVSARPPRVPCTLNGPRLRTASGLISTRWTLARSPAVGAST